MTDTYMLESAINTGCNHIYDLLYSVQFDDLELFQNRFNSIVEVIKEESLDTNAEINLSGLITEILDLSQAYSTSELKRSMLLMAIQFDSICIVKNLLHEISLDDVVLSELIIETIDHSSFDSLDCLVNRLDHPNQLIGSTGCNVITLCCIRGKLDLAEYVAKKHLSDFTLTVSENQVDSYNTFGSEGFLVQILKADLPDRIKFLSIHFAVCNGAINTPEGLSTALVVALNYSPLISNYLILLHMKYDLYMDFNQILLNCVQSRLSLCKKRMILEMISGRFDFEAMEIDDTLRVRIKEVLNT